MEKTAEVVLLETVLEDSLDLEAAKVYLEKLLENWNSEEVRERVEAIVTWLETVSN